MPELKMMRCLTRISYSRWLAWHKYYAANIGSGSGTQVRYLDKEFLKLWEQRRR